MPEIIFNNTVPGTNSETTNTVDVSKQGLLTLQLTGDAESTDLQITAQARVKDTEVFGRYDLLGEDEPVNLTNKTNNSQLITYDVGDLTKIRFEIQNNNTEDTVIKAAKGDSQDV